MSIRDIRVIYRYIERVSCHILGAFTDTSKGKSYKLNLRCRNRLYFHIIIQKKKWNCNMPDDALEITIVEVIIHRGKDLSKNLNFINIIRKLGW